MPGHPPTTGDADGHHFFRSPTHPYFVHRGPQPRCTERVHGYTLFPFLASTHGDRAGVRAVYRWGIPRAGRDHEGDIAATLDLEDWDFARIDQILGCVATSSAAYKLAHVRGQRIADFTSIWALSWSRIV